MKKLFKVIIYLLIIMILLGVVAAVLLVTLVDPNKLKDQMSTWVNEQTGRQLTIEGNIERTFFPWLGLKVHDVTLSNAPGFAPKDKFLEVAEAGVQIKLLPLFSGKVEIGKLDLKALTLNLTKNQSGQNNWDDLIGKSKKVPPQTTTTTTTNTTPQKTGIPFVKSLSIGGIDISNANVVWVDDTKKQTIKLSDFNLKSQAIVRGEAFPVSMKFTITGLPQQFSGEYAFDANAMLNPKTKMYEFDRLKLTTHLPSSGMPAMTINADKLAVDLSRQTLDLASFMFSSGSLHAKGNLRVEQLLDKPMYTGVLDVQTSDLKSFLKAMGKEINTKDPKMLQNLNFSTNFKGTDNSLKLDPIAANLDLSTIKGSLNVLSFAPKKINVSLDIDQLDIDRYRSASSTTSAHQSAPNQVSANNVTPAVADTGTNINLKALRETSLAGDIKIVALTVSGTPLTQVQAQIMLENGIMKISPFVANLYGGATQGQMTADFRTNIPSYAINQSLTHVALAEFSKSDRLTGLGNIHAELTTRGLGKNMILGNLNGGLQFDIERGAFKGVNIPYEIERALALVKKQPLPPKPENNQTDFGKFIGTGTITNGILSNNDLLVESSQFKMTGQGTANLVSQALNYRLNVVGMHTVKDATGQEVQEQRQTEIPLLVTGTFSTPIVAPDVAVLGQVLLKKEVQEKIDQKFEDAKEKAGQIIQQLLR